MEWLYQTLGVEEHAKGERFTGESQEGAPRVLSLESLPKVVTSIKE